MRNHIYETWTSDIGDKGEIKKGYIGWWWRWSTTSKPQWNFVWKYDDAVKALRSLYPFQGEQFE